jgi:signal transduction histidine kinase
VSTLTVGDPAVLEERRRIARELHDVVGHNVSLMVIAAQALGSGADGEARHLGDSIASLGREAMAELATALEQLRPQSDPAAAAPRPSLAALPGLVDRARGAGIAIELRIEGTPRPLPAEVDLPAYRIVQEALTNVIRHARARRASVRVAYLAGAVGLEILDDGVGPTSPAPGHGLRGMGERAALAGGALSYGRGETGGFRLTALLPTGA